MSSRKIPRGRQTPHASRTLMHLERLERRLPLAGDVTAQLVGSTLRLTGDSLGNDVLVASAPGGRIAVIGNATTINGASSTFVTDAAVTAIIADLRGGNDEIGFGNRAQDFVGTRLDVYSFFVPALSSMPFDAVALQAAIDGVSGGVTSFTIPGDVTVFARGGNDGVGINGTVGGSVVVNLGEADAGNVVAIGGESSASRVRGSVTVTGGSRADIVGIGNAIVDGRVSVALGDGDNWFFGGGETATAFGALAYTGGANADVVALLGDVTVGSDVRISTGLRGADFVGFSNSEAGGTVKVRGNVVVNTGTGNDGDTVDLVGDIRGTVTVTTGGGRDTVSVSSLVVWNSFEGSDPVPTFVTAGPSAIGRDLTINTGAGDDLISIGTSTIGRHVRIDTGLGNDRLAIDNLRVGRNLFVGLGAGNDALEVKNLRAAAAVLAGGVGSNSLVTDTATRTANRRLTAFGFRPVNNG